MATKDKKNGDGTEPRTITLPVVYEGIEALPVLFANQFLVQHNAGEFLLTIGQTVPPPLVGSPDEMKAQVEKLTHVPCRVLLRVGMTPDRMRELVRVLGENLRTYEQKLK